MVILNFHVVLRRVIGLKEGNLGVPLLILLKSLKKWVLRLILHAGTLISEFCIIMFIIINKIYI